MEQLNVKRGLRATIGTIDDFADISLDDINVVNNEFSDSEFDNSSVKRESRTKNRSDKWSLQDLMKLDKGRTDGFTYEQIKAQYFPNRTTKSLKTASQKYRTGGYDYLKNEESEIESLIKEIKTPSLGDVNEEARKLGLSYGQYVGLKYIGAI